MASYDERLRELQEQIASKDRLAVMLTSLQKKQSELEDKVSELEVKASSEQADVEKLEKRSVINFCYIVMGMMDEMRSKKRQEACEAMTNYEMACKELAAVKKEYRQYEMEYGRVHRSEERYQVVFKEKRDALKLTDMPVAKEILQLEEEMAKLSTKEKTVEEVVSAGQSVRYRVENILHNLSRAEIMGARDLYDDNSKAYIAERGYLEEARYGRNELKDELRRFQEELADMQQKVNIPESTKSLLKFADFFFDGIVVNQAGSDKSYPSKLRVQDISNKIDQVLERLNVVLKEIQDEKRMLEGELYSLVRKTNF